MTKISTHLSIITLDIICINTLIKMQRVDEWIRKPSISVLSLFVLSVIFFYNKISFKDRQKDKQKYFSHIDTGNK